MSETLTKQANYELRKDTALLLEIIELLEAKTPIDRWPEEASSALNSAMELNGSNRFEQEKAARLKNHLFVGMPPPATATTSVVPRRVDRIRADLADLTDFGAGLYMTAIGSQSFG